MLVLTKAVCLIVTWDIWETYQGFTNYKPILSQVTAWCPLTTSHYLSQYCPRSILSNGITRSQWVNKHNVMNCIISYICLICYALGNLQAYITILICTAKIQYDISYEHCNDGTTFDQISIFVLAMDIRIVYIKIMKIKYIIMQALVHKNTCHICINMLQITSCLLPEEVLYGHDTVNKLYFAHIHYFLK